MRQCGCATLMHDDRPVMTHDIEADIKYLFYSLDPNVRDFPTNIFSFDFSFLKMPNRHQKKKTFIT
ncbi:9686_t:CDS:1, partial [Gigaspora rosea]